MNYVCRFSTFLICIRQGLNTFYPVYPVLETNLQLSWECPKLGNYNLNFLFIWQLKLLLFIRFLKDNDIFNGLKGPFTDKLFSYFQHSF